ncbi:carboxylesterase type B [Delitschia confertaspora ATCC 74209]|uniref:Carboxylic ester hydrolase n=1 Tax=Delitschia confertaspora ATCC 74209 TaxID=1513339 RepID=A0A9P4JUX2_9PLEO|nr:carboxylesterase type B [Delitschia confertaspora ATCC 74209]
MFTKLSAILGWSIALSGAVANAADLKVDVGYAVYQGGKEASGLNVWKGIRYATAPRWKAPQIPATNRTIVSATTLGAQCPQAFPSVPNAPFLPGDEDCLFLNVFAPANTPVGTLPVLVWFHGGGYGLGAGNQDMTEIINANNNGFVAVSVQYRLGAFGWLSSAEVKNKGVVNAGLLDMIASLGWIQKYITKFGGDPRKVTITGESAGAGAIMLLSMAFGGQLGTSLFRNGISASTYLPPQYNYDAAIPTARYNDFAAKAGCVGVADVFNCLVSKDSMTLQKANNDVSISQAYGTWGFVPVTDGQVIQSLPSAQLKAKRVNGAAILVGNNANEGALFAPQEAINTVDDLKNWLKDVYPTFNDAQVQQVLDAYPSTEKPVNPNDLKFATNGLGPATAVNVSQVATGQQQRAYNIYAEATFICPGYWLNTAFPTSRSFHYQYSVPFASHGDDQTGYFGPATPNQGPLFTAAFRKIWGSFVMNSVPVSSPAFPTWEGNKMMNLNQTGGTPYEKIQFGTNVTQYMEPGLKNAFSVVDAYTWEGRRGKRCEFWRNMAVKVPM